ncbi:hypothetical protein Tco_1101223, partial [Tanacetum coccineum]
TLILAEDGQPKMKAKLKDPICKEKKVNINPIDYKALNELYKYFVPLKHLSAEQAFCLPISKPVTKQPVVQLIPVKIVVPRGESKNQSNGSKPWGFEHIRKVFEKDVIPFMKSLRELFQEFDKCLHVEINEMKVVFNQMEFEVEQCSVDKKCFEIQKKEPFLENDRLLELIISQDIVHTAVNSYAAIVDYKKMEKGFVDEYNDCLELKVELSKTKDMIEQDVFIKLSKIYSKLE